MILTAEVKKKLETLWFNYGNGGANHTTGNHGFIQQLIQYSEIGQDVSEKVEQLKTFYQRPPSVPVKHETKLSDECYQAVKEAFNEDN